MLSPSPPPAAAAARRASSEGFDFSSCMQVHAVQPAARSVRAFHGHTNATANREDARSRAQFARLVSSPQGNSSVHPKRSCHTPPLVSCAFRDTCLRSQGGLQYRTHQRTKCFRRSLRVSALLQLTAYPRRNQAQTRGGRTCVSAEPANGCAAHRVHSLAVRSSFENVQHRGGGGMHPFQ